MKKFEPIFHKQNTKFLTLGSISSLCELKLAHGAHVYKLELYFSFFHIKQNYQNKINIQKNTHLKVKPINVLDIDILYYLELLITYYSEIISE